MGEHHSWYNGSLWHIVWPYQVYVGHWPIFYGPAILLHILKTIWWRNVVLGIMDQCDYMIDLYKIYGGQWPIFHGPLILPYINYHCQTNYFYTLRNGTGQGYWCPSGHLLWLTIILMDAFWNCIYKMFLLQIAPKLVFTSIILHHPTCTMYQAVSTAFDWLMFFTFNWRLVWMDNEETIRIDKITV